MAQSSMPGCINLQWVQWKHKSSIHPRRWCHRNLAVLVSVPREDSTLKYVNDMFIGRTIDRDTGRAKGIHRDDRAPRDQQEWEEVDTPRPKGMGRLLSSTQEEL